MDHFRSEDHVMVTQVPVAGTRTIYSFLGDWFNWICLALLSVVLIESCFGRPGASQQSA
jgi:apolipoprotein N-acyltransferase